jgi:hypothetical protein
MAKRTRYPGRPSGRRPGSNRSLRKSEPRPARPVDTSTGRPQPELEFIPEAPTATPLVARSSGLTEAEVEAATELEAEATERERAAVRESLRRRAQTRAAEGRASGDVNAPLSVRAAHEYAYVARDVRRIILTGGLMVAILATLDILVNVLGVVKL